MTADGHPDPSSALLARRDARLDDRGAGPARPGGDVRRRVRRQPPRRRLRRRRCSTVLESLEAAEAAGLVAPLPGRPGRFAFVHALFRSHRYDALPLRRRLDLHAAAAGALASPSGDGRLSERARHACLSVPVGDAQDRGRSGRRGGPRGRACLRLRRGRRPLRAGAASRRARSTRRTPGRRTTSPPDSARRWSRRGDPRGVPMLVDVAERARREGDDRRARAGGELASPTSAPPARS